MRKYFQDYESQEDDDYNPTKLEEAHYRQEHENRKQKRIASHDARLAYQQTKEQYYLATQKKVKIDSDFTTLEVAQKILNSDSLKPNKRVVFAGKEFIMNEETGQLEEVQKKNVTEYVDRGQGEQSLQDFEKRKTHIAYQYLNHVMKAIYNRSRKINSVGKSKLDWKGFVKQEGIEAKLEYHRRGGGEIDNMRFIKQANQVKK